MSKTIKQLDREINALEKQLDREIKAFEKQRAELRKKIQPLEAQRADLIALEKVKKAPYNVGQRVEYRLDGSKTVLFGLIKSINTRRYTEATFLVERTNEKGELVGFSSEVQAREIFGASHK